MGVGSFSTKLVNSEIPSVNVVFEQQIEKKLSENGWIKVLCYLTNGMIFVVEMNVSQLRWRGDW